jgi:P-type E1-E2 ATPase
MLELIIPGFGEVKIKNVVFDLNGTLAVDGLISDETRRQLKEVAKVLELYVLTADTHGTFNKEAEGLPVTGRITSKAIAAEEKLALVEELGAEQTIAVGNGNNDILMLKTAAIGIAVMGEEGASSQAIASADLVVKTTTDALNLLLYPKRLIASLRG